MKKMGSIVTVLLVLTSVFAPIYQNSFSIGSTTQLLPASYVSDASLPENFTIVVLPDTQGYSQNYPSIFNNQTQWIADNVESLNILFVTQLGDLVNIPYNQTQWENANQSMSTLDGKVPWEWYLETMTTIMTTIELVSTSISVQKGSRENRGMVDHTMKRIIQIAISCFPPAVMIT
jgi:hypothetical protein